MRSWKALLLLGALVSPACAMTLERVPDADTLASIADAIENLKQTHPQLKEFSRQRNLNARTLSISYAYRTHEPRRAGGWTAGVPNPEEDGIWFYIDFHHPASTAQIHTQPMSVAPQFLGNMRVSFLILEGAKTASVYGPIWQVLRKHGVTECRQ